MDLSDNFLDDGSIPTCLFEKLSVLESLDISHNNIRGFPGFFSGNADVTKFLSILCSYQFNFELEVTENASPIKVYMLFVRHGSLDSMIIT